MPTTRTLRRWMLAASSAAALALAVTGCTAGSASPAVLSPGSAHASARPSQTPTPTPTPTVDPAVAYVESRLSAMTLRQKVAGLFMLHAPGTDPAALQAFVARYGLGGLILMGDNIPPAPEALAAETAATRAVDPALPPLIGIDEEGGDVTRLPWDGEAGAEQLRAQPPAATQETFARRAQLLKQAGVSVNFGTVADVTADRASFIYGRVLGTDPGSSAERVAASVAGERGAVLSTLKHFPGHGETDADSHLTVPTAAVDLGRYGSQDEPSFRAGIGAGAEFVMFGHLIYSGVDAQPASLSPAWHRILSERLGFRGVSITDDMRMLQDTRLPQYQDAGENAVQAVAAGNTMILMVQGPQNDPDAMIDAVVNAVAQGRIPVSVIDADARKLLLLRHSLAPKE